MKKEFNPSQFVLCQMLVPSTVNLVFDILTIIIINRTRLGL